MSSLQKWWVSENLSQKVCRSVHEFAKVQNEYVTASEQSKNDVYFVSEEAVLFEMSRTMGSVCVDERKADKNPPTDDKVVWRTGMFYGDVLLETRKFTSLLRMSYFWTEERLEKFLIPIITRKTRVTPCLLDFFCVNFTKNPEIIIRHKNELLNVHRRYEEILKSHHRGGFDPHRRIDPRKPDKVWFFTSGSATPHSTTVAQLYFLHWVWTSGILAYVEKNFDDIKRDHIKVQQDSKRKRDSGDTFDRKRKREEIRLRPDVPCSTIVSCTTAQRFERFLDDD